jgi:uncharacterized protein YprB with RNaseH-like and TPR domain
MNDLRQQLAELRARVARVSQDCDRKYALGPAALDPAKTAAEQSEAIAAPEARRYLEECLSGEEVQTAFGRHFETEKLYEAHRHHGSADIGALTELPHDLLGPLSGGAIGAVPPEEWAFLDTETTGLAGGTGTCAFLVGVGRIERAGFRVRQFFMRDYSEESSLLDALARYLKPFRVMITYNGRAFDQPLLETRYRLQRARPPFSRVEHLDLLYGARRLWKLRFESCRLTDLENQVLGVERQGDLPGALIPYVYFEYLRTRLAARLLPVFQHNATDILTLACLTGIVPYAFRDPERLEPGAAPLSSRGTLAHGAEMVGLARWLREAGEHDRARELFRRAIDAGLSDALLFPTLRDLALAERKAGAEQAALEIWEELAAARNPFRVRALEELAKHHEHRAKNRARALELTRAARALADSPDLQRREARLVKRLSAKSRVLL